MDEILNREVRLRSRPTGLPTEGDFEVAEVGIPELEEGEVLVQNLFMSVDPYMRGRMIDRESYLPPFQIGAVLEGGCVGRVVRSKNDIFQVDDMVSSMKGWREFYVSDGWEIFKIDPAAAPIQSYLGVMGMPGLTAYVGLLDIGGLKEGETVFVTAASGAVGSIVCQIARIKGCRVIGSAGSDEKVAWLIKEAGVEAAFNYKKVDDLSTELGRLCPKGIDVAFENVGGGQLEASLERMNIGGRVVLCGMISLYNAAEPPPGPDNLYLAITKSLKLEGFIISNHLDRMPQFQVDMNGWIAEDRIKWRETIVEGIESAAGALIGLFRGENMGKMLVRLGTCAS